VGKVGEYRTLLGVCLLLVRLLGVGRAFFALVIGSVGRFGSVLVCGLALGCLALGGFVLGRLVCGGLVFRGLFRAVVDMASLLLVNWL